MKFAIKKGSPAYEKLEKIFSEMKQANRDAIALAEKIYEEATQAAAPESGVKFTRGRNAAGGVAAIVFETKPKGWVNAETPNHRNLFRPAKGNKETLDKMESLPIITRGDVAKLVGYESPQTYNGKNGEMIWSECPSVIPLWEQGVVLIECDDQAHIKPVEDMEEIMASQYHKYLEQDKAETV